MKSKKIFAGILAASMLFSIHVTASSPEENLSANVQEILSVANITLVNSGTYDVPYDDLKAGVEWISETNPDSPSINRFTDMLKQISPVYQLTSYDLLELCLGMHSLEGIEDFQADHANGLISLDFSGHAINFYSTP